MYRVIIVDDNPIILSALALRIPYKEMNLSLQGTYTSAQDALASVNKSERYIVITDIAMPGMDGLLFTRELQAMNPKCVFICITGFERIDYLQRAIECHVSAFLFKPIDDLKLREALNEAIHMLEHQVKYDALDTLSALEKNSKAFAQYLMDRLTEYPGPNAAAGTVLRLDVFPNFNEQLRQRIYDALPAMPSLTADGVRLAGNLLFSMSPQAQKWAQSLNVANSYRFVCTATGISGEDLDTLVAAAHNAIYGVTFGSSPLKEKLPSDMYNRIKLLLDLGMTDEAVNTAISAMDGILRGGVSVAGFNLYLRQLSELFPADKALELPYPALGYAGPTGIRTWLFESATNLPHPSDDAIDMVLQYIRTNMTEPLTLTELAEVVHMHPNYLGKVIRKRSGYAFNDLLNRLRIERSTELLRLRPDIKLHTLAEHVGYTDVKYFSRMFKQYMGMPPGAYLACIRVEDNQDQ